ncbi:MarR family transcriptional regulator [Mycolicibacterium septicum DSM 44393]|uniref:MarR family transcriptional regulator n=1 Tax=Mycolicibacterium septicum DSM 44393 TaxID=1341646 RepID=A0A7X6MM21_9MYCO|nr:helix-turn-helix domain-containing protein [Mycolicibacterium septicum]NKZ11282.1 MarR family transcriptional regulator [Mycolicibacterium septicum DSM 44393]
MDRQKLHRLGKRLIALSKQVEPQPGDDMPGPAEQLILTDVVLYPGSTIRHIVARTGFTQGYVSKCVATLAAQGLLTTTVDGSDRRRTLVAPSAELVQAVQDRTMTMEQLIADALPAGSDVARTLALLDELSELFLS